MDSMETDDQLTIINRSTEHHISKKLIRKIPYFEKMLSHDLKESKENKVELDFDEQAFKIIIDWVESHYTFILIEMNYVMQLYELADYFGLDSISKDCITYFYNKFTIQDLPIAISTLTKTTKFIPVNPSALNAFICRYFFKIIINSYFDMHGYTWETFWLTFPIETIEYICALDLMIYSEMKVFEAIMRWVNFKAGARKCYVARLLKLVRWCHLDDEDLSKIKENELFKSSGFEPIFCAPRKNNCDCAFNRAKQNCFVMIETLNSKDLRVKVLDNNMKQLVSQVIKEDASIDSNFFHDEHVSDILFDSGRSVIRIDWKQNKYNLVPLQYTELQRRMARSVEYGGTLDNELELGEDIADRFLLLESAETFVLICSEGKRLKYFSMPTYENYENLRYLYSCSATFLENKIYLFSNKSILYELFIYPEGFVRRWTYRLRDEEFRFENVLLTSSPAGDKIILINKNTKDYICFDVDTKRKSKGQMVSYSSADGQKESKTLLTFTSAFLPLNIIRTCLNSKPNTDSLFASNK